MRIGINFSNTTMLDSIDPVFDSARQCDADGFAHWWLPQPDFAAVEVGTNPEEKQRTRALLKKAAASERKMQ